MKDTQSQENTAQTVTEEDVMAHLAKYEGEDPMFKPTMLKWMREHEDEYNDFKTRLNDGDEQLINEIFQFATDCMPQKVNEFNDSLLNIFEDIAKSFDVFDEEETPDTVVDEQQQDKEAEQVDEDNEDDPFAALEELFAPIANIAEGLDSDTIKKETPMDQRAMIKSAINLIAADKEEAKELEGEAYTLPQATLLHNMQHTPALMAQMINKIKGGNNLLACAYCYITFDGGLPQMLKLVTETIGIDPDMLEMFMGINTMQSMISTSLSNGIDTKQQWKDTAKELPDEWQWRADHIISTTKGRSGAKRKIMLLEDILPGKAAKVGKIIKRFLRTQHPDNDLAYILYSLQSAGLADWSVDYMTFHYALQLFMDATYSSESPQTAYNYLRNRDRAKDLHERKANGDKDALREKEQEYHHHYASGGEHLKQGKRMIEELTLDFANCRNTPYI